MHIAALKPEAIDESNLDQEIIDKESNIFISIMKGIMVTLEISSRSRVQNRTPV